MRIEVKNEFPFILFLSVIRVLLIVMGMGGTGRVALSFGLSIAVVPLLGLILNYTPWGIRLYPILLTLLVFTILLSVITIYRRNKLSLENGLVVYLNIRTVKWGSLSRLVI